MTRPSTLSSSAPNAPAAESPGARPSRSTWVYAFKKPVLHLISIVIGLVILVPIIFGVLGGFKDNGQLTTNPIGLPDPWIFSNYADILTDSLFWKQLMNSTIVAVATTLIVVGFSAGAAYVFARFAFRGREFFFTLFAIGLMFPFAVAILPLFVLLRQMDLLNNPFGVILPQAAFGLPVTIIILRSFFRTIPGEIEESATLDGCGRFGFFWRVLLPMARPALATVSVLAVVGSWNGFFLPLVIFQDPAWWTLPLGVTNFQETEFSQNTAAVLAYVTLSMVPALLFYSVAERQLISGLSTGVARG
jgi:raffinose/stachyose/melibiose transport system permease protein